MATTLLADVVGILVESVFNLVLFLIFQSSFVMSAPTTPTGEVKKVGRWYFGGMASAAAACCTHPLDLLKVHMQTGGAKEKIGVMSQTAHIIRSEGILALYSGLSASLLRQLTYSTTRFAIYEVSQWKYYSVERDVGLDLLKLNS